MLIENQKIEMRWNSSNKKWYESKGYTYTKNNDYFLVNAEDLSLGSHVKVKCMCDYCKNKYELEYRDYIINIDNNNGKNKCYFCNHPNTNRETFVIDSKKHGSDKNRKPISEVIKIVESKNNNKLLNPYDYINVRTNNLQIICGSCGEMFTTSLASIINDKGSCGSCGIKKSSGLNKLTPNEVKRRINSVNGNILLNPEEYISNSTPNLKIKCGDCGKVYITTLANYEYNQKIRCDSCSQRISVPERRVIALLDKYNIEYIYNHKFNDCKNIKPLPFDFYLFKYNLIIETDGEHHFRPIWGEEHFKQTKQNDSTKNQYCKSNNINLLRIPYWDFDNIEDILIEKLDISTFITSRSHRKRMIYKPQNNKNTTRKIA